MERNRTIERANQKIEIYKNGIRKIIVSNLDNEKKKFYVFFLEERIRRTNVYICMQIGLAERLVERAMQGR